MGTVTFIDNGMVAQLVGCAFALSVLVIALTRQAQHGYGGPPSQRTKLWKERYARSVHRFFKNTRARFGMLSIMVALTATPALLVGCASVQSETVTSATFAAGAAAYQVWKARVVTSLAACGADTECTRIYSNRLALGERAFAAFSVAFGFPPEASRAAPSALVFDERGASQARARLDAELALIDKTLP